MKVTVLRRQLYEVVDRVLASGVPAEIERNGRKLLIVPAQPAQDRLARLARLKRRKSIVGKPESVLDPTAWVWREPRNLR